MRFIIFLILANFIFFAGADAQQNNSFHRWYIQQEVGMNFSLSNYKMNNATDHLISLREPNPYWKILNIGYNFSPAISVQLSYQMNIRGENKRNEKFGNALEKQSAPNFYLLSHETNDDKQSPYFVTNVERGMIGFFYSQQIGKLKVSPGLSFGMTYFYSDSATAYLKERGTNQTYQVSFISTEKSALFRTFSPSFMCLYPIGNRHELFFQAAYFLNFYDITYQIETKNIFENTATKQSTPYQGRQHTLGLGAGIRFNLGKNRPRSF